MNVASKLKGYLNQFVKAAGNDTASMATTILEHLNVTRSRWTDGDFILAVPAGR